MFKLKNTRLIGLGDSNSKPTPNFEAGFLQKGSPYNRTNMVHIFFQIII